MEKNKKEPDEQEKISIPKKISLALKYLRVYQPQSFVGLILFALFLQTNYYFSRIIFKSDITRMAIYALNIFLIVFFIGNLPSNFIDFLFPSIPVVCSLKQDTKTIKKEIKNKGIDNKKEIDLDSIMVLIGKKDILEDQYFDKLLILVDTISSTIKIQSRLLDKFTLLTISGFLSTFFALLLLIRRFSFFLILHFLFFMIFIYLCFYGFRVIYSIRSSK